MMLGLPPRRNLIDSSTHRGKIATRAAAALWLAGAVAFACPHSAHADTVYLDNLPYEKVSVKNIEGGQIEFLSPEGNLLHKPVKDSIRLKIDDEPHLNTAEDDFYQASTQARAARSAADQQAIAAKYADAADEYQKTYQSTAKPWLKDYVLGRLQESAERSGRFDLAVAAWANMLAKNPDALKNKPKIPANPNSQYLTAAVDLIDHTAQNAASDDVKKQLLLYELDLQRARHDDAAINKLLGQLVAMGAADPAIILAQIHSDVDAGKFSDAQSKLASLKPPLSDPALQIDYQYLSAVIEESQLAPNAPAATYENVALDFMKVVAANPQGSEVPRCLLKVAALHEKFDPPTAINLYKQITKDYADQPAIVKQAQDGLTHLQAASNAP